MSWRLQGELHPLDGDWGLRAKFLPWRMPWDGNMPYCDGCLANESAVCGFGWLWLHVYVTKRWPRVCDGRCPRPARDWDWIFASHLKDPRS